MRDRDPPVEAVGEQHGGGEDEDEAGRDAGSPSAMTVAMMKEGKLASALGGERGGQSHSDQLTVIKPGPHSCPFWQRAG